MNSLDYIDVHVIGGVDAVSQGDNARALLNEIDELLRVLLEEDQPSHIDLRRLPLAWPRAPA